MKVYITRDTKSKLCNVWLDEPRYYEKDGYYIGTNPVIMSKKTIKELYGLDRTLNRGEIVEGTMTFKVKVK